MRKLILCLGFLSSFLCANFKDVSLKDLRFAQTEFARKIENYRTLRDKMNLEKSLLEIKKRSKNTCRFDEEIAYYKDNEEVLINVIKSFENRYLEVITEIRDREERK